MAYKKDLEDTQDIDLEEYEDEDDDYEEDNHKLPIIIGIIILVIFLLLIGMFLLFKNLGTDSSESESTPTPSASAEASATAESSTTTLDYYYLQSANTAIIAQLDNDYSSGYTKPNIDQFKVTGSQTNPTITFDLTIGSTSQTNYIVPAEFHLSWDSSNNKYNITTYSINDKEAKASDWDSSSAETAKKENQTTTGSQVSSFDVSVSSSVTVSVTSKSDGKVTAYAIAEDGTMTELATAQNNQVSQTVSLDPGSYTLALYAEEGTGYSWSYNIN